MNVDIERFQAGDETLFSNLVTSHSPRVWRYLQRYANRGLDARDLLQETWLRAFSKRHTFDGRGSFVGWLLTVARTVGLNAVRSRSREPEAEELADVATPGAGRQSGDLLEAVLALPERQREVLLLRLVEGLTVVETAERLQCAEGTVKASLHHATQRLRLHFGEIKR